MITFWEFVGSLAAVSTIHVLIVVPAILFRCSTLIEKHMDRAELRWSQRFADLRSRVDAGDGGRQVSDAGVRYALASAGGLREAVSTSPPAASTKANTGAGADGFGFQTCEGTRLNT